jgi:hypothetical protein
VTMAAWVTLISAGAAVKLKWWVTASNALSAFKGGILRFISISLLNLTPAVLELPSKPHQFPKCHH